jgi:hypothetical protein
MRCCAQTKLRFNAVDNWSGMRRTTSIESPDGAALMVPPSVTMAE